MTAKCAVGKYNPSLEPVLPLLWGNASLQGASWSSKQPPSPRGGWEVGASLLAPLMVPGKGSTLPCSCFTDTRMMQGDWDGSSPSMSRSPDCDCDKGTGAPGSIGDLTAQLCSGQRRCQLESLPCDPVQHKTQPYGSP